jgi:hypothetical protein
MLMLPKVRLVALPVVLEPTHLTVRQQRAPIALPGHNRPPPVSPPVTIALPVNGPMPLLPKVRLVALPVVLVKPVPPLTGLHKAKLLAALALTVKLP